MAEIHGQKSYLCLAPEAAWGTLDGSPAYVHIPVDAYTVANKRDRRNAAVFTGQRQRHHGKSFRGMPSGKLTTAFYGWEPAATTTPIAKTLLDWAFNPGEETGISPDSMSAEWAEGPDIANVRHLGLRVNSAELSGSADSGRVMIDLDLMGKSEAAVATAQTLPTERNKAVEAEFSDCTFSLAGSAIKLASFSLKISNSLKPKYLNGTSIDYLAAGMRQISLQFVPVKIGDVYAALNRAYAESEVAGEIFIKGLHNGTGASGSYWGVTIAFTRLAFIEPEYQRPLDELFMEPLNFEVLKPQSSTQELGFTWALV